MRILMFGWEFPPRISGGLGTACFGMTAALAALGHRITFVLPHEGGGGAAPFVELVSAAAGREPLPGALALRPLRSPLHPYLDAGGYRSRLLAGTQASGLGELYGPDLIAEVERYGRAAARFARAGSHELIHAHDWMTVPAALLARRISGRPLVLHIHSLEYDRSGEHPDPAIREIEREGLARADRIIAVSHRTKRMIQERYGIPAERVSVVHNAVTQGEARRVFRTGKADRRRIVLFLGRITFQKGPDYFAEAAARVLRAVPDVTFVMAGAGDMMGRMIERIGELGIGDRFHFTGFLQGEELERIFAVSDLYVMPSVSEPFGITPLEAIAYDVPVILSRQSGVAEILQHALKVDFWDVEEMAAKMIAVLNHPALAGQLVEKSREALRKIRWENAAVKIDAVYRELAGRGAALKPGS